MNSLCCKKLGAVATLALFVLLVVVVARTVITAFRTASW